MKVLKSIRFVNTFFLKKFMDPLEVPIDQARRPSTIAENRRFMNFFT